MPNCKYCGKNAGLFSFCHKECKEKWEKGSAELLAEIHAYFKGQATMISVQRKIVLLRRTCFINDEDVVKQSGVALRLYADTLSLPITPQHLQMVDTYIKSIGVSKDVLNADGCLDYLGKKMYAGVLASFYNEGTPVDTIEKRLKHVEALLPVSETSKKEAGIDHMAQAVILQQIQNGIIPPSIPLSFPIVMSRGESALWCYDAVTMYEEKVEKEYQGSHSGFNIRVMKGVRYNTGRMHTKPVEHSYMPDCGTGSLIITNKHLIFCSSTKSIKIPYSKLIGLTPYCDGVELHRDGNAKRLVFKGFDCWMLSNLLSLLNQ